MLELKMKLIVVLRGREVGRVIKDFSLDRRVRGRLVKIVRVGWVGVIGLGVCSVVILGGWEYGG